MGANVMHMQVLNSELMLRIQQSLGITAMVLEIVRS